MKKETRGRPKLSKDLKKRLVGSVRLRGIDEKKVLAKYGSIQKFVDAMVKNLTVIALIAPLGIRVCESWDFLDICI